MKNEIKQKKLWIVIFYNAESDKDWEIVVASTYDIAIKTAKTVIREQCGLEKGEKLECTDFEAYLIGPEYDIYNNRYEVILKEIKNNEK